MVSNSKLLQIHQRLDEIVERSRTSKIFAGIDTIAVGDLPQQARPSKLKPFFYKFTMIALVRIKG